MTQMNRRDFLKLAGLFSSFLLLPKLVARSRISNPAQPNIIFLVFDAMSARNLSVYGYPRPTSPNLERFAEHATVYHEHYAAGNFTTPGVSSLLTGTYPWTHRAINHRGLVRRDLAENNIFSALGQAYTRVAFPQNFWANFVVTQFEKQIDLLLPSGSFSELALFMSDHFENDQNMAARAIDDFAFNLGGEPAPLVLGSLQRWLYSIENEKLSRDGYPAGAPHDINYPLNFRLENVFNGLMEVLSGLPSPYFAYLHLLPPHSPYSPTDRFYNLFRDGMKFPKKPEHPLSEKIPNADMLLARRMYDEYVASTDWEFGRMLDFLDEAGLFENSYVFVTSDHGEMFERGDVAHSTPLLYDPVVHIPLLISAPGQKARVDVHTPTSAVDILPTLASLTGGRIPSGAEGMPLPGLGGNDSTRSIYVVEAKLNTAYGPLKDATVVLRSGGQKLVHYTGYGREDAFELYDLDTDIDELDDLYEKKPAFLRHMKDELLEALYTANKPYVG
jgi:arylsulfatase A-like enzyme